MITVNEIGQSSRVEWTGLSIERMLRVQTEKLEGPGLDSMSSERRNRAKRKVFRLCKTWTNAKDAESEWGLGQARVLLTGSVIWHDVNA